MSVLFAICLGLFAIASRLYFPIFLNLGHNCPKGTHPQMLTSPPPSKANPLSHVFKKLSSNRTYKYNPDPRPFGSCKRRRNCLKSVIILFRPHIFGPSQTPSQRPSTVGGWVSVGHPPPPPCPERQACSGPTAWTGRPRKSRSFWNHDFDDTFLAFFCVCLSSAPRLPPSANPTPSHTFPKSAYKYTPRKRLPAHPPMETLVVSCLPSESRVVSGSSPALGS